MSAREEWFSEKLSKLLQEELRVSTLTELKDHLTSLPREEAQRTANGLHLSLVFDCLNDTNCEQVDLACDVLSLCMNNLNLGESTNKYIAPLEKTLNHPYSPVKLMTLKEVERSVANEQVLDDLCKRPTLINNIIVCIGDNDLAVSKKASNIIISLGTTIQGINALTTNNTLKTLQHVMGICELVRLRVYEVLINISVDSEYSFDKLKSSGLISRIVEELNSKDVLLKTNIVEILTPLAVTEHGYTYFDENRVLDELLTLLVEESDDYSLQLCQPGIIKFFGNVCNKRPVEVLSKYPGFFDYLFSHIETANLTTVGIILDTLGYIAQTNNGKQALHSTGSQIMNVIKKIPKLFGSLPTDLRVRALNCLENLLHVSEMKSDVLQITRQWYELIDDNPMEIVLRYAKNPFSELRVAGLGILNAIAGQIWGQEAIKNTPGLIEFLLDRRYESIKECKEKKYDIVKQLALSPVFDHITSEKLNDFVKQGPFYVQALTEIAIEGNE